MPVLILIATNIVIVWFLCSALFFGGLRKLIPRRAAYLISALLGPLPLLGLVTYYVYFSSPLPLPKGAKEVNIRRAHPCTWTIDDNLRFHVTPDRFRAWLEKLCAMNWESMQASATIFIAFRDGTRTEAIYEGVRDPAPQGPTSMPLQFGTPPWMDTSRVRSGYYIKHDRAFPGLILYDAEQELVYYNYSD